MRDPEDPLHPAEHGPQTAFEDAVAGEADDLEVEPEVGLPQLGRVPRRERTLEEFAQPIRTRRSRVWTRCAACRVA